MRLVSKLLLWSYCLAGTSDAAVLVSGSGGLIKIGYGQKEWRLFSDFLDAAAGDEVIVAPNLEDGDQMMRFDSLLVDQRWYDGHLSDLEVANIEEFISTGRRVLLIGEWGLWSPWNQQILGLVGGEFAGTYEGPSATTITAHELTDGVDSLWTSVSGYAEPTPHSIQLFDTGVAAFGESV